MAVTIESKKIIICNSGTGVPAIVGVVDVNAEIPEVLQAFVQPFIKDGTSYYRLMSTQALAQLSSETIDDLAAGEPRRQVVGNLTDEDLIVLDVLRNPLTP